MWQFQSLQCFLAARQVVLPPGFEMMRPVARSGKLMRLGAHGIDSGCLGFWDVLGCLPSGEPTNSNGKSPFLMGKSTISMAIFNCYVSSPEGMPIGIVWKQTFLFNAPRTSYEIQSQVTNCRAGRDLGFFLQHQDISRHKEMQLWDDLRHKAPVPFSSNAMPPSATKVFCRHFLF